MTSAEVYLRKVRSSDEQEFIRLMRDSQEIHEPWITPPVSSAQFKQYMQRVNQPDHEGYAVCLAGSDAIAGAININNIVRGSFQSASLGYYIGAPYQGQGIMYAGLSQLLELACVTMGLHRLEANIQPENIRSQRLVERCGFVREGISKDFLYINGEWRDHVRWCYVDQRTSLRPASMQSTFKRWQIT